MTACWDGSSWFRWERTQREDLERRGQDAENAAGARCELCHQAGDFRAGNAALWLGETPDQYWPATAAGDRSSGQQDCEDRLVSHDREGRE